MAIQFTAHDHKYKSIDPSCTIEWTSVTTFVGKFKAPFDKVAIAQKCARSKTSKWKGLSVETIIQFWEDEAKRATDLGTFYHNQREADLLSCETFQREGIDLPIIKPLEKDGVKFASSQILKPGIYPEHMIYLKSAGVCGQADRVEVIGDSIDLYDYKTNKEIKMQSFTSWDGTKKMMLGPCSHLEDCNFNHYALQLSTYMYMMLKHNHYLNPRKLEIQHVTFEVKDEDEYGNPIMLLDSRNEPIVKSVIPYEVPYLKEEVINMIKYLQTNG
jgi:hypothetical protein